MRFPIKSLHRLSGIVIACFLLLHITNHLFALGGPALHIAVMRFFRHLYRFPPVEIFLLLCVLFQVISGLWLVFSRGFRRQPFYVVIQVLSGLYLSFFMIYHVRAVLTGRYQWKVPTDFYFAAGVANRYPEKLFFIPYYALSLISVFAHIACVHYTKRVEQMKGAAAPEAFRKKYIRETTGICIAGAVITFLIMIALTGMLYPVL